MYDRLRRVVLDAALGRFVKSWSSEIHRDWIGEAPLRMHKGGGQYAADGAPEWTHEFETWIEQRRSEVELRSRYVPYQHDPQRSKTTTAMRKLRKHAPREFLVCYDATVLYPVKDGENLEHTCRAISNRLNQRAIQRGFPERYSSETVAILLLSGLDKLAHWRQQI